jgi:hypothetical protein
MTTPKDEGKAETARDEDETATDTAKREGAGRMLEPNTSVPQDDANTSVPHDNT